jgi:hypothetical protein
MAQNTSTGSGELLQIGILAAFFTAVGFALVTAILVFFVNPRSAESADVQARKYQLLTTALEDRELSVLRQTAKNSEGEKSDMELRDVIHEKMTGYGLTFSRFPAAVTKENVVRQKLTLQPAPMAPILQFVADIEEVKTSVHVLDFRLQPARGRGAEEGDSWTATIEFVDFVGAG